MNLITKARNFAWKAHEHQTDDSDQPFVWHPIQVAMILSLLCPNDTNLICAGYLHDILEDTLWTHKELTKEFNKDIADLVNEVTKEGKKDSHGYYFPRLKTQRGIMLKFADRLSNVSRMEAWDDKKKEWYLKSSKFWRSE